MIGFTSKLMMTTAAATTTNAALLAVVPLNFLPFWHKQVFAISLFICFPFSFAARAPAHTRTTNHFRCLLCEHLFLNACNFKFSQQKNPFILLLCASHCGSSLTSHGYKSGGRQKKFATQLYVLFFVGSVGLFVHPFDLQQPKNKHIFHVELREWIAR